MSSVTTSKGSVGLLEWLSIVHWLAFQADGKMHTLYQYNNPKIDERISLPNFEGDGFIVVIHSTTVT